MKRCQLPTFYILFLFILKIYCAPNSSNSVGVGKCDPLVSKLLLEFQASFSYSAESYFEHYQNLTDICKSVSNCYESLEGEPAKKLKKIYDLRCEKYEFYSYNMMRCFEFIIMDRYAYFTKCGEDYDFTTNNLAAKRKALYDGQSCVMEIAEQRCYNISSSYLKTNYDKFVDILTVKPDDEYCDSVFAELNKFQCKTMRTYVNYNWDRFRKSMQYVSNNEQVVHSSHQCKVLEQCSSDSCNMYPNSQQMGKCEVFGALASDFNVCIEQMGGIPNIRNQNCMVLNDKKECIRSRMIEECGEKSVKDFENYYDFFTKNDLNDVIKFKIIGNYSEYDEKVGAPEHSTAIDTEIGKCYPFVEELITDFSTETQINFIRSQKEAFQICINLTSCYQSINSSEAQVLQSYYQFVCEEYEWSSHYMHLCLNYFYSNERYFNDKSIDNSDFFSQNTTIKRRAFIEQKDYFMEYANRSSSCSAAKKYLNENYDHFVDLITIKPENDDCKSVFSTATNYPCTQIIDDMVDDIDFENYFDSAMGSKVVEECRRTKKCLDGTSCISVKSKHILDWCESAKQEGIYFYSCLYTIRKDNRDYSSHYCAQKTVKAQSTDGKYLLQFESNRGCLKYIMLDECGSEAVRGFNEYFDRVIQQ